MFWPLKWLQTPKAEGAMNKLKASFSPKEKGLFCALKIPGKFILAFDFRCQNRILSSLATLFPPSHTERGGTDKLVCP